MLISVDSARPLDAIALLSLFMGDDSSITDEGARFSIEQRLRDLVARHPAGERLPSTRTLVADHAASPLTVQRVVQQLVLEGLVETRPGAGNFVARRRAVRQADFGWQTTALGAARVGSRPNSP